MQTPFITDLTVTARKATALPALVTVRHLDHEGRTAGTSVMTAQQLAETGRALLAMAEATVLHCVAPETNLAPPRIAVTLMHDVHVADREAA